MRWLSHSDIQSLMRCIKDIYSNLSFNDWHSHILSVISRLIPNNVVACGEVNPLQQNVAIFEFPSVTSTEDIPILNKYLYEHPIINLLYKTQLKSHPYKREIESRVIKKHPDLLVSPECMVVKISDLISKSQLHSLNLYNEYFRKYDFEYQFCIPFLYQESKVMGISFYRDRKDFSERDRLMLNLLAPHINQVYRNAEAISAIHRYIQTSAQAQGMAISNLTLREAEVLYWLAQGKSNPDIAIIMEIKVCTVKKHLENIYHKLGVENRTSALLMTIGAGIDKPIKKGH